MEKSEESANTSASASKQTVDTTSTTAFSLRSQPVAHRTKEARMDSEKMGTSNHASDETMTMTNINRKKAGISEKKIAETVQDEEMEIEQLGDTNGFVWDEFVRDGSQLKRLVHKVFQKVTVPNGVNSETKDGTEQSLDEQLQEEVDFANVTADIARQKTAECMILQKKLKDSEANASALEATNDSLKETISSTNDRLEKTVEALKLAGTNAVKARNDATTAEKYAASLASKLEALELSAEETSRQGVILQEEHDELQSTFRTIETKLLERELEIQHSLKDQQKLQEELDAVRNQLKIAQVQQETHDSEVEVLKQQCRRARQRIKEQEAIAEARSSRHILIEKELRAARVTLRESANSVAQSEAQVDGLQETVTTLRKDSMTVNMSLKGLQDKTKADRKRFSEELAAVRNQIQQLRVEASTHKEDMTRVEMEKEAVEAKNEQLKHRVATLERHLKESTRVVAMKTPPASSVLKGGVHIVTNRPSPSELGVNATASSAPVAFTIPALEDGSSRSTLKASASKMPHLKPRASVRDSEKSGVALCCICLKNRKGLLLACPCGQCDKRAHKSCITKLQSSPNSFSITGSTVFCHFSEKGTSSG